MQATAAPQETYKIEGLRYRNWMTLKEQMEVDIEKYKPTDQAAYVPEWCNELEPMEQGIIIEKIFSLYMAAKMAHMENDRHYPLILPSFDDF